MLACRRSPRFRVQRLARRVEWISRRDQRLGPTKLELQGFPYCTTGLVAAGIARSMSEGVVTTTSVTILIEIANESKAGHSNILQMRSTTAASAGRRGSEYFPTVVNISKPRVVTVGVFLLSGRDSGQTWRTLMKDGRSGNDEVRSEPLGGPRCVSPVLNRRFWRIRTVGHSGSRLQLE